MDKQTANLQTRMTVAQAATAFKVSERSIYTARRIRRIGSPELIAAIERGELTLNRAAGVLSLPKEEQYAAAAKPDRTAPPAGVDASWNRINRTIDAEWKNLDAAGREVLAAMVTQKIDDLQKEGE